MLTQTMNMSGDGPPPPSVSLVCIACGGTRVPRTGLVVERRFALCRCDSCGLGFLDLRSDDGGDASFDEYWDDVNRQIYVQPAVVEELRRKYSRYFGLLSGLAPSRKFLDVGSGSGISVDTAARHFGFDAMGVEPSARAVELSRQTYGIRVVCDLLRADDQLPRDFGVLALWDVIEHVPSPERLLRDCALHLAEQGLLILETPDEGTLFRAIIRTLGRSGVKKLDLRSHIYYRAHRYYFTRTAMGHLLRRCGFDEVRFFSDHTMYEKEICKKRFYLGIPAMKERELRLAFSVLRTLPLLWNKMVVVARKRTAPGVHASTRKGAADAALPAV